LKKSSIAYPYDESQRTDPGFNLANWITDSISSGVITIPTITGSEGITVDTLDVQFGSDTVGTGTHDFTATRYLFLDTFNLQVGGDYDDEIFTINGTTGKVKFNELTTEQLTATDASKQLQSLDTATY